jgi:hypothetical protein
MKKNKQPLKSTKLTLNKEVLRHVSGAVDTGPTLTHPTGQGQTYQCSLLYNCMSNGCSVDCPSSPQRCGAGSGSC